MKYKLDFSPKVSTASPPITGAYVSGTSPLLFAAWQPSTWPAASASSPDEFVEVLKRIFEESILGEVRNVIEDITKSNGTLAFRGHVVAIAMMCALDAISAYGYLHAGVRVGARALGIGGDSFEPKILPKPFARLAPSEIEDCLCIYKKQLLGDAPDNFRRSSGCVVAGRPRC
jgi:hypothetical protein